MPRREELRLRKLIAEGASPAEIEKARKTYTCRRSKDQREAYVYKQYLAIRKEHGSDVSNKWAELRDKLGWQAANKWLREFTNTKPIKQLVRPRKVGLPRGQSIGVRFGKKHVHRFPGGRVVPFCECGA